MSVITMLKTPTFVNTTLTGTVTTAVASDALVGVGTAFDTELSVNGLIIIIDDAGTEQYHVVETITNATNVVLRDDARSVTTGLNFWRIGSLTDRLTYFFQARLDATDRHSPIVDHLISGDSPGMLFQTQLGGSVIDENEGILIKTIQLDLPFQFTLADTGISLELRVRAAGGSGNGTVLTEVGGDGLIWMPQENLEIEVDAYIPPFDTTNGMELFTRIQLAPVNPPITTGNVAQNPGVWTDVPQISNLDSPTLIHNMYLPIQVAMKVLHADARIA